MFKTYYNDYSIDSLKKYLVLFVGNFSIPHKGHIFEIEKFFNKDNIEIVIYIGENRQKHGMSKETSLKIWNIHLKNVHNANVFFFDNEYKNILEYHRKKYILLIVRGIEQNIDRGFIKISHGDLIKKLKNKKITTHVLFIERIPKISSTEIFKNLDNLKYYLPENILDEEIKYIKELIVSEKK